MSDERWLRDALRRATSHQPVVGDLRANGALRIATTRKRQRIAMASVSAAFAVFVATSATGGGSRGLEPVPPVTSPTSASETPYVTESPSPGATPNQAPGATTEPSGGTEPTSEPQAVQPFRTPGARSAAQVDVYFLVDQTGDMYGFNTKAVTEAIVARMRRHGDHIRYGYGLFRDITQPHQDALMPVYDRIAPIGDTATWTGSPSGGGDTPEADTIGLMASVGWTDTLHVRQSEPAGFSAEATPLIVLITNAAVKQGLEYPTIDETANELRSRGIAVASVLLGDRNGFDDAVTDLTAISAGTDARTAGQVDCDGDGAFSSEDDLRKDAVFLCRHDLTEAKLWSGIADGLLGLALSRYY